MENITKENFNKKIKEGKVLVDFWAEWCGPCRVLSLILEEIENMNLNIKVLKVNVDEEPELSNQYQIRSIPTIYYFADGILIDKKIGFTNKMDILNMINNEQITKI